MISLLLSALVLLVVLAIELPLWVIGGILLVWILVAGFGRKKATL